jgi:hypothetical protein
MTWEELMLNCRNAVGAYLVPLSDFRMIVPPEVKQHEKTERGQLLSVLGNDFEVTQDSGWLRVKRKKAVR